jgi:hypothetical protein
MCGGHVQDVDQFRSLHVFGSSGPNWSESAAMCLVQVMMMMKACFRVQWAKSERVRSHTPCADDDDDENMQGPE